MREVLLKAGYEGGSITLFRSTDGKRVRYFVEHNQVVLAEMLADEDEELAPVTTSKRMTTFERAFAVFDRRPDWAYCFPLEVHAEVAAHVLAAVEAHHTQRPSPQSLEPWRQACQVNPNQQ